jgi:multimeric flavodoxin WrbA
MKVLGINASPRGNASRTKKLVEAVLRGAEEAGAETEFVDICTLDIAFCTGCLTCCAVGECTQDDDFGMLFDAIMEADGIVLGSPVYIDGVTAQLKQVFDRMADAIHCQRLYGKYGCAVSTTGGSGDQEVIDFMNRILTKLGAVTIGGVGVALGPDPEPLAPAEKRAFALGKELTEAILTEKRYPEQEAVIARNREYFRHLVTRMKNEWGHEYRYWVDKGWLLAE